MAKRIIICNMLYKNLNNGFVQVRKTAKGESADLEAYRSNVGKITKDSSKGRRSTYLSKHVA